MREGVTWRGESRGSSRAPGSAPAAPWTAPALLASSVSQPLNPADSRASSPSRGCCHSPRERPAPPSDVTTLHLTSPGGAGPAPALGSAEAVEATQSRLRTGVGITGLHDPSQPALKKPNAFGAA